MPEFAEQKPVSYSGSRPRMRELKVTAYRRESKALVTLGDGRKVIIPILWPPLQHKLEMAHSGSVSSSTIDPSVVDF
jgi:hypothetical protein